MANAYEEHKRSPAKKHKYERVAYQIAKTDFINEFTKKSLLNIGASFEKVKTLIDPIDKG